MKLRTQLVLAFLLLAVAPLSGIVLYSYYSSLKAVRQAAEKEAWTLAEEMDGRMASIRRELGQGVERIGDVSVQDLLAAARSHQSGAPNPILDRMVRGFGEAAPLVKSLEFIPMAPAAPPAPPAPVAVSAEAEIPATVVVDVSKVLEETRRSLEKIPGVDPRSLAEITREQARLKAAPASPSQEEIERRIGLRMEKLARQAEQIAATRQAEADRAALVHPVELPVRDRGAVVCTIKAQVWGDEMLRRVLARTRSGVGEVPFALDARGNLHTVDAKDRERIARLPLSRRVLDDWVVATSKDPESGVTFGIARQVPLGEVRRTAARNFGYGLGMIGLALLGILPLSARISHNLRLVTVGAERIAHGDLDARVPVRSRNEVGQLALTFNRMAEDLKAHQERLLEEEGLRRQREVEQARLRTEYDRKSLELEEARRFQLSLLPKSLPEHPGFEIAVSMRTATEVGGDYYDFHLGEDGSLTVAVGDATGHGARAGTMVTAVKSLFSAFAGRRGPRELLDESARAVRRMELGRMAMGLCVARLDGQGLTLSSAGMPPVLVHRRETGKAEEIALQGMPLGGFAAAYQELSLDLAPGDTVLMMTDGLPELADAEEDPLGYPRVRSLFESLGQGTPEEVIAGLARAAESWTGGLPIKDDVTLVAIRRCP
jgi:serine phosphatase RsbU (regulator of sigma subunit)